MIPSLIYPQQYQQPSEEQSMKVVNSTSSLFRGQIQGSNPEKLEKLLENQLKITQKTYNVNNELILSQFASQTQHQTLINKVTEQLKESNQLQCDKIAQMVQNASDMAKALQTLPERAREAKLLLQQITILEDKFK